MREGECGGKWDKGLVVGHENQCSGTVLQWGREQLMATATAMATVEVTAVAGDTTSVSRVLATVLGSAPPSTATIVNVRYTLP